MMKKLFAILIPICILSFVAGGVLNLVLGKNPDVISGVDSEWTNNSGSVQTGENKYTVYAASDSKNYELEAMDNISLMLAGVDAKIMASNDDKIHIAFQNVQFQKPIDVAFSTNDRTSTVEIHPTYITFDPFNTNLINWLEELISGTPACSVWILIPQKNYESFTLKQGSGIVDVNIISAKKNDIQVGSGELNFINNPLYHADEINLELGSGKATIRNANTDEYNLKIGSGKFEISELTGVGDIKMGSGDGVLSFSKYEGIVLEKGSGTLDVRIPSHTPIRIYAKLGSGDIDVNLDGEKQIIKDNGEYYFGRNDTNNFLRVNNGSGKIYINNIDDNIDNSANSSASETN